MTGLSRVTVRKGVAELVASGQLVQRRGSGTFVAPRSKSWNRRCRF
jgi:GntR family transcriptional regulator